MKSVTIFLVFVNQINYNNTASLRLIIIYYMWSDHLSKHLCGSTLAGPQKALCCFLFCHCFYSGFSYYYLGIAIFSYRVMVRLKETHKYYYNSYVVRPWSVLH